MIEALVLILVGYFLGYWAGKSNNMIEDIKDEGSKVSKIINNINHPSIPTGQIKPKTAKDIQLSNMPKEKREGLDAMRETLEQDPEFKKRMETLKKMKFNDVKGIYEL
jgi:hypothetical protein